MKTITTTFNVYTFEELNKEAQNKVKESIKTRLYEFRSMEVGEYLGTMLCEDYNIGGAILNYSLSYSQGDGVCFYGVNLLSYFKLKDRKVEEYNPFEKWCAENLNKEDFELLLQYLNEDYNIKAQKDYGCNYEHSHSCFLDEEFYNSDDWDEVERINDFIYDLKKKLTPIYHSICKELEKFGYQYLEDIFEEEIMDEIAFIEKELGFNFYIDGSYYYGG